MANKRGKAGSSDKFPLFQLQNHCGWWQQPWNETTIASWQESNGKLSVLQKRYITLQTLYSQGYGLPSGLVWLWELELKKAEPQRTDAFELWCWTRLLKVPWTARRSNQSILRVINCEYSSEGLMVKLKLQYFFSSDANSWLIGNVPDWKDWAQEKRV